MMARRVSPLACLLLPLFALLLTTHVDATIFVPEEIPSLLSVVYSNLPPIKKGTDSKLGVGFRLGPNADVQFQLEIGPQTHTRPIGNDAATVAANDVATKKRHATAAMNSDKIKDWLNKWRLQLSQGYVPDDEQGSDEQKAGNPDEEVANTVAHLRQLYKPQPVTTE